MTPAQRLAEWQEGDGFRSNRRWYSTTRRCFAVLLELEGRKIEGTGATSDAAITAALDAWQKGDG